MSKLHLGVLGSGAGSNMQSIVDAIEAGTLDAEIKLVLADVADAKISSIARRGTTFHASTSTARRGRRSWRALRKTAASIS